MDLLIKLTCLKFETCCGNSLKPEELARFPGERLGATTSSSSSGGIGLRPEGRDVTEASRCPGVPLASGLSSKRCKVWQQKAREGQWGRFSAARV